MKCDTNVQATVLERELDRKSYKNDDDTFNSNVFPKSCYQCGKSGMRKNGYCILYDQSMKKYLAYCDFSSEPGYAWTLAMSLARDVILYDFSKVRNLTEFISDDVINMFTVSHLDCMD